MSTFDPTGLDPTNYVSLRNAANAQLVDAWNKQIFEKYKQAIVNYNASMDIGRDFPGPPPVVPKGYKLTELPDEQGVYWFELVDGIILPLPVHEKVKSQDEIRSVPNKIHILHSCDGGRNIWFTAAEDDTFPSGQMTPPGVRTDDGVVGQFLRVASVVGNGWYQKVG